MYLHRYPHIQSIHPYINSTHVCTYPNSAFAHLFFWWWNLTVSCSHVPTIYSVHSHRCGRFLTQGSSNQISAIMMCLWLRASFLQSQWKPTWATLLGIMAVELNVFVPPRCVHCCSETVYVQNFWTSDKNGFANLKLQVFERFAPVHLMFPVNLLTVTGHSHSDFMFSQFTPKWTFHSQGKSARLSFLQLLFWFILTCLLHKHWNRSTSDPPVFLLLWVVFCCPVKVRCDM